MTPRISNGRRTLQLSHNWLAITTNSRSLSFFDTRNRGIVSVVKVDKVTLKVRVLGTPATSNTVPAD